MKNAITSYLLTYLFTTAHTNNGQKNSAQFDRKCSLFLQPVC